MKRILLIVAMLCIWAFNANALVIGGHDYELLTNVDPYSAVSPDYNPGSDLGYFVWATDESRRSWSIRWSGDTDVVAGANYLFSGNVALSANAFEDVLTWSWDSNDNIDFNSTLINWYAIANVYEDGFDFTIVGDEMPSYLGFDLNIFAKTSASTILGDQSDYIFIGADKLNPVSGDFAMAAPVPEPSTFLLLGGGLIGLAYYRRRK